METLQPLPEDRKCFRLINGVLVERTVKDVLPAVKTNSDGLKQVLGELVKQYKGKQDEMDKWKVDIVTHLSHRLLTVIFRKSIISKWCRTRSGYQTTRCIRRKYCRPLGAIVASWEDDFVVRQSYPVVRMSSARIEVLKEFLQTTHAQTRCREVVIRGSCDLEAGKCTRISD